MQGFFLHFRSKWDKYARLFPHVFFCEPFKAKLKKNARPYGFTVRFRAKCDTNARLNALRFFMHFRAKFDKMQGLIKPFDFFCAF